MTLEEPRTPADRARAEPTRAEAGSLEYDLDRSLDERGGFVRLEGWTEAAALEAHKAMPYMRASFEKRQREGWTTRITLWEPVAP